MKAWWPNALTVRRREGRPAVGSASTPLRKAGFIVMSGKTDPAEAQSFQQLDVQTISKPLPFGELLESVQALTRGTPEK